MKKSQSKFKTFFAKIGEYLKNTAWIQPLLIVIIIFVVLFSLGPITNAIRSGWTSITTTNHMEKISYKDYVDMVKSQDKDDDKFVVVFTRKGCDVCPIFYKSMNTYLDSQHYKAADFKIYNVDLTLKSSTVKASDGKKYSQYKDSSLGIVSGKSATKQDIINQDYIWQLDKRIEEFVRTAYEDVDGSNNDMETVSDSTYTYISTPLVIWYDGGLETRIANKFTSLVTLNSDGKRATPSSFKTFIEDFGGGESNKQVAMNWNDKFDLEYFTGKNIKDVL